MVKTHPTAIALGQNKGHPITKFQLSHNQPNKTRPASRKGALGKRVKLIRQLIG